MPGRFFDSRDSLDIPVTEMYDNAYMTENETQFNQCIADRECSLNYICLLFNSADMVLFFVTKYMRYFSLLHLLLAIACIHTRIELIMRAINRTHESDI